MTMPVKMTCRHSKEGSAEYIRADIAKELAMALEDALVNGCSVKTLDALDRYREITP